MKKTQLQETGWCDVRDLTVLEIADIVATLGIDPRCARVREDALYVSSDRLCGGQPVQLG